MYGCFKKGLLEPLVNTSGVHTTARYFRKKTFDNLVPQHISAIIHTALVLRRGSAVASFRRRLLQEIRSRLKLYYNPAPEAAAKKDVGVQTALWTVVSKGGKFKRISLSSVLTGLEPHVFPRPRWIGSALSVEDLGPLQFVHSLLSSTWYQFMAAHGKPENNQW